MGAALVGAGERAEEAPGPHPGVYGEGDAASPGLRRSPLALSSPGRPLLALIVVVPFKAAGVVGSAQSVPGPIPAISPESGLGGLAGAIPPDTDEEKDALPRSGATVECEVGGGGPSWG